MDGQKIYIHDNESKNLIGLGTSCDIPSVGEEIVIYGRDTKETRYEVISRSMTLYQGSQNCTWKVFVKNIDENNTTVEKKEEPTTTPSPAKTTSTKNNTKKKK